MNDLTKAIEEFKLNRFSCILCCGEKKYSSTERGIAPLIGLIYSGKDLKGFSAADKIIGKAAAMLYCLMEVKSVYAPVVSRDGLDLLKKHGIIVHYDTCAEKIINRTGTDICPMEKTVSGIDDIHEGYLALLDKVNEMKRINK